MSNEYNPYADYPATQWWADQSLRNDEDMQGVMEHAGYYNKLPQLVKSIDPGLGKRKDRGLLDMIYNYMGGYDMAARDPSNIDKTRILAKAYQYGDYGTRPVDAVGDYWENIAGIDAYNPDKGRISDQALFNQAKQYAQDRLSSGQGQYYDTEFRLTPWLYEHTLGRRGPLSGY